VRGLLDAGADGIRVGMGSGSVATGQQVKAVGRAQVSAIYHTARTAKEYSVPVIADGGIVNSGCIAKSLSMGASCVMMGSLLAGTEQSPGEYFFQDGMRLKKYHGSTSHDAVRRQRSASQMAALTGSSVYVSQGVSGSVADKGSIEQYIPYLAQSLRHGMQDMGASSIVKLHELTTKGQLRFELRTHAAQREGGVHDLFTFSKAQFA
jgi:IMP dehydrogenase